jgi:twinkle protein
MSERIQRIADEHLSPYRLSDDELIPYVCPFCKGGEHEDHETFAINLGTGLFKCHRASCNHTGKFDTFVAEITGVKESFQSFPSLPKLQSLGNENGGAEDDRVYEVPKSYHQPPSQDVLTYFNGRGITPETLSAYKVGWTTDTNGGTVAVLPCYQGEDLIFAKYRFLGSTPHRAKEVCSKDAKPILFGMHLCNQDAPLVITEGLIDAMSLHEAGIPNAVSIPMGTNNMDWIGHCWNWLSTFKSIILFGDSDEPGQKMVQKLVGRLDADRCSIVSAYPPRQGKALCKDANEILMLHGKETLRHMVNTAMPKSLDSVKHLEDVPWLDRNSLLRIHTGIPELDRMIGGMMEGCVTVLSGKTGDGKSTLASLLLLSSVKQRYPVCAYSGELGAQFFKNWVDLQLAGSSFIGLIPDAFSDDPIPFITEEVSKRLRPFYKDMFFLVDNQELLAEDLQDEVIRAFEHAAKRYGCRLFLVDNLMTALFSALDPFTAQARFMATLKLFARKFSAHVLVVAHPRKTDKGTTIRLDDLSGNSVIGNLADNVVVVERPNIRVLKNRSGGTTGVIECIYEPDSRRIYSKANGDCYGFEKLPLLDYRGIAPPSVLANSLPRYLPQVGTSDINI